MKKIIALLLVAVMCFSLAACGGDKETSNNNEPQTNNSETQQENESNTSTKEELSFVGTWVGTTHGNADLPVKMIINEDGTGSWEESGETQELTWAIENEEFVITRPNNGFLNF